MFDLNPRLEQQIRFIVEIDALKQVLRQTAIMGGARRENSAEHSWHLAVMALTLAEHAGGAADILRVLKMLLVHDIVEIDAGDTFCYDAQANLSKAQREQAAATRIFGLLPAEQGRDLRALWEEFEDSATPEARFANALDRLEPLLHNYHNQGGTWRAHGITRDAVLRRMAPIEAGAPALWPFVQQVIAAACAAGYIVE
jgi:5'-deoxynucleotidase YfbR-like HD superfamily hydrolase